MHQCCDIGQTVLRPIASGSKVLSDTGMKYGASKAEMFAVITFVDKYRTYLGNAPFKLRVDNRPLAWLKTYSMDQSYIGRRWIVRLDGYHMINEHRTRYRHQKANSLSKKTEFYERLVASAKRQIRMDFHFWTTKTTTNCQSLDGLTSQGIPYQDNRNFPWKLPRG